MSLPTLAAGKTPAGEASGALAGTRVLDLADKKGAYCGKLLADMGADVIKIEPPGGDASRWMAPFAGGKEDSERSLFFQYMNTSKRGVVLNLATAAGRMAFRNLAWNAHVIIETFPPDFLSRLGIGYDALSARNPVVVMTSITGFGATGPYRQFKTSDIVASALGGAMHVIGDPDDPPARVAGHQAYVTAGACAAASILIAVYHASATGRGRKVDISLEEVTVATTHVCGVGKWLDDGIVPRRMGTGLVASVPSGTYRCKDGLVYLMINRPRHWQALAEWISEVAGRREVLEPLFEGPSSNRLPHRDLLDFYINDLTSRFTVKEIYHEAQRRHIAVTPVNTVEAVAHDPHLKARHFFVELDHAVCGRLTVPGAPFRHSATPWQMTRPAPTLGEHNVEVLQGELGLTDEECRAALGETRSVAPVSPLRAPCRGRRAPATGKCQEARPLSGIRVLEFTAGMAGPWIGRFMAYCGAEVIKIESRHHPDVTRLYVPPWAPEMGLQPQLSPWFTDWNAGKKFAALDLTKPEAVGLVRRLAAKSDVVVENYATGVMDKLGLGYAALKERKPDLIMFSTSGYGDTGPYKSYITWGPNIETLSGMAALSGFPHRECAVTQYAYPDPLSAFHGMFAVLCALYHRRRTGEGQYVNLSQYETAVAAIGDVVTEFLVNGAEPPRLGNGSRHAGPHGCYRCKGNDRWCAIAVETEEEWRALCRVIGRADWLNEPRLATRAARVRHAAELDRGIEQWTAEREAYEVMAALQRVGVAAGVVQNVEDLYRRDRQLAARGFFEEIDHLKKGKVVATGIPLGLTETPGSSGRAGAAPGEDNDYVFGELLGLTPEEIRGFIDAGAIEATGGC